MEFDEPTRQLIARAVRERRAQLGLSQEQAARASRGMISTANLRVVEGAGRASLRPKSLIGVARALSWPSDALTRIAEGADAASLPTVTGDGSATTTTTPSAGGVELATAADVARLQGQIDEQRVAIIELGRRLEELGAVTGDDGWSSRLLAAHSGDAAEVDPEGPRRSTRRRVESFDPGADD